MCQVAIIAQQADFLKVLSLDLSMVTNAWLGHKLGPSPPLKLD